MITQPDSHIETRPAAPDIHLPRRSHLRPAPREIRATGTRPPNIALAGLQILIGYEWLLAGGDKLLLGGFPAQLGKLLLPIAHGLRNEMYMWLKRLRWLVQFSRLFWARGWKYLRLLKTREREKALSSQIAVEVKLVAQPVGQLSYWRQVVTKTYFGRCILRVLKSHLL